MLFSNFIKFIFINDTRYLSNNKAQIKLSSSFFLLGSIAHCTYAYKTSNVKMTTIVKKYKMVRKGFTEFMIIDIYGDHYNINNSFWFWKWNSIEDWNYIKEGDKIIFNYYGWRLPIFGLFPNIYCIEKQACSDK
jgi:hypothetical protein